MKPSNPRENQRKHDRTVPRDSKELIRRQNATNSLFYNKLWPKTGNPFYSLSSFSFMFLADSFRQSYCRRWRCVPARIPPGPPTKGLTAFPSIFCFLIESGRLWTGFSCRKIPYGSCFQKKLSRKFFVTFHPNRTTRLCPGGRGRLSLRLSRVRGRNGGTCLSGPPSGTTSVPLQCSP